MKNKIEVVSIVMASALFSIAASAATEWSGTPWQTVSPEPGTLAEAMVLNGQSEIYGAKDVVYPQPSFKVTNSTVTQGKLTKIEDWVQVDLLVSPVSCFSLTITSENFTLHRPKYDPGLVQFFFNSPPKAGSTCGGHQPILLSMPLRTLTSAIKELDRHEFTCKPGTECLIRTVKTEYSGFVNLSAVYRADSALKPSRAILSYVTHFSMTRHPDGTFTQVVQVEDVPHFTY